MKKYNNTNIYISILKFSVIAIFLGRGWQYYFWDAPYRTFLWDQSLMEPVITGLFKIPWHDWASSMAVDKFIQGLIKFTGILYFLTAFSIFIYQKEKPLLKFLIYPSIFCLILLAGLETKEKFYHIGQFFEHASQICAPLILIGLLDGWLSRKNALFVGKIAIGLTFFCHGLYAINYYPRPGVYVDMYIGTFGISEALSHQLIFIAGIIDIILPLVFLFKRFDSYTLAYASFWGIITAFARLTTGFYWEFPFDSLHQVWFTTSYRLVHGLLPFSLILIKKPNLKFSPYRFFQSIRVRYT